MHDRAAIIDTINAIGIYADKKDWEKLEEQFAEQVLIDYTSLFGGEPVTLKKEELLDSWKTILPGFDATMHQITCHQVEITFEYAKCISSVRGFHLLENDQGDNYWDVIGFYEHMLEKRDSSWKVTGMKLDVTMVLGNKELPEIARNRASG